MHWTMQNSLIEYIYNNSYVSVEEKLNKKPPKGVNILTKEIH